MYINELSVAKSPKTVNRISSWPSPIRSFFEDLDISINDCVREDKNNKKEIHREQLKHKDDFKYKECVNNS